MGTFIVIDGGEGVGKTTLVRALKERYPDALFTREPGGTPLAEELRGIILGDRGRGAGGLARLNLFWAARADHVEKVIRPALAAGKTVICDRFDSSTFAYQVQHRLSPLNQVFWLLRDVCLGGDEPHYVILDVSVEEAQRRVHERGGAQQLTHYDLQEIKEHEKIRQGFRRFASLIREGWGMGEVALIDSAQPKATVAAEACAAIDRLVAER